MARVKRKMVKKDEAVAVPVTQKHHWKRLGFNAFGVSQIFTFSHFTANKL
jgi:hypothetical protein